MRKCAFGCVAVKGIPMHRFPNRKKFLERFNVWVNIVRGTSDPDEPIDVEFYLKSRVCDIHFCDKYRNRNNRLNANAIPSLKLPSKSQAILSEMEEAACHDDEDMDAELTAPHHNEDIDAAPHHDDENVKAEPASPHHEEDIDAELDVPHHDEDMEDELSTHHICTNLDNNNAVQKPVEQLVDHNYSASTSKQKNPTKLIDLHRVHSNITKLKEMKKNTRYLNNEINRLRKKYKILKDKFANTRKQSVNVVFQKILQQMTKPAQLFVKMQCQSIKKAKGRRYTLEEKLLTLTMYKKSPQYYKFLCQYFSLPSSKVMKRLLFQIKSSPDINNTLINKIKKTMENRQPSDCLSSYFQSFTPHILNSPPQTT